MCERSLMLRKAYDDMTISVDSLRQYRLNEVEWELVEETIKMLEVFKVCLSAIERSVEPTLWKAIPIYNEIGDKLNDFVKSTPVDVLKKAARAAKHKMDLYYAKTERSEAYSVATVLNPLLKTVYWDELGWKDDWKVMCLAQVRTVYDRYVSQSSLQLEKAIPLKVDHEYEDPDIAHVLKRRRLNNNSRERASEPDLYLAEDPICVQVPNLLAYWQLQEARWPALATMAGLSHDGQRLPCYSSNKRAVGTT